MNRDTEQYRDIAVKSLAVLGLLTILALGSFLTLTALSYVPKFVRSVGNFVASTTPEVTNTVATVKNAVKGSLGFASNKTALSTGSSVTLFWDKSSAEAGGSYALTYPCMSGVSVSYKGTPLSCNVPFYLDQDAEEVTLTVESKKARNAEVPFALRFTKNGETRVGSTDTTVVAVTNAKIAGMGEAPPPAAPAPKKTASTYKPPVKKSVAVATPVYNPVYSIVNSYVPGIPVTYTNTNLFYPTNTLTYVPPAGPEWGQADLRPVILDMGILDTNRNIISTRYMSRTSKAAIRFAVENIGTKTSHPWVFNAVLPTSPRFTYLPEFQPPLRPGERIEYTLSFDRVVNDENSIVITVDPAGTLAEATKANNQASVTFTAF
ncbi:MAG TPA: hypothetical protein VD967_02980 [Candidatus Paceibacterota bacterium]|nr:hypothetical protein [Candidatus Paceibacterota bacterium]